MKAAPIRQRGAAILLAMIILALITTAAAGMVWQQTRAVQVEAAERAREQSGWILTAALDWARLILREDVRASRQRDALDEPWATPLAEARLSTFLAADKENNADAGPDAFLSGSITDAQSRFNLRGLVDAAGKPVEAQLKALQLLADLAGAPSDTAARIAAGLARALVPQSQQGDDPAGAPLRPEQLADLVWLGIDQATVARLAPWIDLLPMPTSVNANTAPREVLMAAIDIDAGSAQRLVQARQSKPFENPEALKQILPAVTVDPARVGVASSWFIVRGRLRLDDRVLEERSLVQRDNDKITVRRRERQSFVTAARDGG